jgi:hypothetical protein
MKPHQVRSQSKRAEKSTQARKTTGNNQQETLNNGKAQKRSTAVHQPRELDSYRVLTDHALASLPKRITERKKVLQALFCIMTPAHPDHARVYEEYNSLYEIGGLSSAVSGMAMELENARNEAAALFHFMLVDAERQRYLADKGVIAVQASPEAVVGILTLGERVDRQLQACYENAFSIAGALNKIGGAQ